LLSQIKSFVQTERDLIVKILNHLREIEYRRLYSDLGYSSLFDYAVKELRYSEGQASRRIQAMRLIKDLPEIETKIASGELSLTNAQQAQSLFREMKSADPMRQVIKEEKLAILAKIENKSVREAEKELVKLRPATSTPKERERIVTETMSELRIPMSDKLKAKLEEFRSHLGPKGATMGYADLLEEMADVGVAALKQKRFGKKRTQEQPKESYNENGAVVLKKESKTPAPAVKTYANPRYITRADKHAVWQRDEGRCVQCGATKNLNFDHIVPVGYGGRATPHNLRLLCFSCNQRASTKVYGRVYDRETPL